MRQRLRLSNSSIGIISYSSVIPLVFKLQVIMLLHMSLPFIGTSHESRFFVISALITV